MLHEYKVDLLIQAVKHFAVCSWARELPPDLAYDRLLDKARSHETAVAEYYLDKESRQDSIALLATFCASIDAVCSSESYRGSHSKTCGRCGYNHTISDHCPALEYSVAIPSLDSASEPPGYYL